MLRPPIRLRTLRIFITTAFPLTLAALWLAAPARVTRTVSAQTPPTALRNFESPQVHPLALTPDGTRLLAVNSPNATLSVFQLTSGTPVLTAEIPVGLEPVSVAARTDREAWVVNWLSDSVSVVDLTTGNVTRTLDVGDEPTDVVFAGHNRDIAFVCVSGGGRMSVSGTSITGASGAVKFFLTFDLSVAPGTIEIFGKQPRALERNATGERVFVSVFESGNQTTVIPERVVAQNGGLPPPSPAMAGGLPAAPSTSLVVRWNGAAWADESGNTKWDPFVTYKLADVDLLTIDAVGNPPEAVAFARGLGTHLGNMALDPTTNRLYVVNIESDSVRRFEPNLRGTFQATRVSALDTALGGTPTLAFARDLNPHVDLSNPAGTDAERALSLALPGDIERASDGTLYVSATGSAKVGVLDALGNVSARVAVGNGPTGLALDEARQRLYVLNRHDQTLSVVSTSSNSQTSVVPVGFNPEQPSVRNGRRFLYDAANFSAHGTVACASCHPAGHRDGLAWDLGDPTGSLVSVNGFTHHPMKGPMTTQSLRGLFSATPLHWRADRSSVSDFNVAFTGLLGSKRLLTPQEMSQFTAFVNTLSYPPNPNENPDRTFPNPATGPNADTGSKRFRGGGGFPFITLAGIGSCNTCHQALTTTPHLFIMGSDRVIFPGSIFPEPQAFKVPQLRGIYQKAGLLKPATGQPRAEQLTGFGFGHDGTFDTTVSFMRQPGFTGFNNDNERRDIEAFLLSFDSVLSPAVGMQATVNAENKSSPDVLARIGVLVQQSQLAVNGTSQSGPGCDLVVRGIYGGRARTFMRQQDGTFQPDSRSEARVTLQQLLDAAGPGSELTFTGAPVGEESRFALDHDGDQILDDDEPRTSVRIEGRVVTPDGFGITGVGVDLTGSQSASVLTDTSGRYVFNFVSTTGTHTVTPRGQVGIFAPASATFVKPTWDRSATFITSQTNNAADASRFFVAQHYADFLGREPDASGLQFWTNEIESCGTNQQCREVKRINVSAAFFLSIEFQETGFLAYRARKVSFGDAPGRPVPVTFPQLMGDAQRLGRFVVVGPGPWQAQLGANKDAFFLGWVQRPEFVARFPATMSAPDFAAALNNNAGGVLTQAEFNTLVSLVFNNNTPAGRAAAVRFVAENAELARRETNRAFVLMQYHGYMRRDPEEAPEPNLDFTGYNFWLGKLNEFNGNFVAAEMVKAFITSTEYRGRFGRP